VSSQDEMLSDGWGAMTDHIAPCNLLRFAFNVTALPRRINPHVPTR
jgi:hypothetical protein